MLKSTQRGPMEIVTQTHYLVYEITNKINGKTYIGCHRTKNVNDNYMGSGKIIKRSIAKNGIENFDKEILFDFNNSKGMFDKEVELIATLKPKYNIHEGGMGGWEYINKLKLQDNQAHRYLSRTVLVKYAQDGLALKSLKEPEWQKESCKKGIKTKLDKYGIDVFKTFAGRKHSAETIRKISDSRRGIEPWNKGVPMSDETKNKIRKTFKNKKINQ